MARVSVSAGKSLVRRRPRRDYLALSLGVLNLMGIIAILLKLHGIY